MTILYTDKFVRLFKKLPPDLQDKAIQRETIFQQDPFSRSLRTHKLSGKFSGYYSFSVDYKHRIIFRFLEQNTALFLLIGDHSIYD